MPAARQGHVRVQAAGGTRPLPGGPPLQGRVGALGWGGDPPRQHLASPRSSSPWLFHVLPNKPGGGGCGHPNSPETEALGEDRPAQCSRQDPWDKLVGRVRGRKAFPVPEDQARIAGLHPQRGSQDGDRSQAKCVEGTAGWDAGARPRQPSGLRDPSPPARTPLTRDPGSRSPPASRQPVRPAPDTPGPCEAGAGGCTSVCRPRSPSLRLHCLSWPVAFWDAADPPLRGWGQGAVPGASTGPGHNCAAATVHARPASVPTGGPSATSSLDPHTLSLQSRL